MIPKKEHSGLLCCCTNDLQILTLI